MANESATKFALRLLWTIFMLRCFILALRMKFRWKFKFHGPPFSPLHHDTAFDESDSRMNSLCLMALLDSEILIALWIARTSALFISMKGIGVEKRQIKFPLWFLRTPPIAEHDSHMLTDASTFHLTTLITGGHQTTGLMAMVGFFFLTAFESFHNKQDGFREMSDGEYGKFSSHAEIHHPSLSKHRIRDINVQRIVSANVKKQMVQLKKYRGSISL